MVHRKVGYKSVDDYVTSGMVVGLGTGSTAAFAGKAETRFLFFKRFNLRENCKASCSAKKKLIRLLPWRKGSATSGG